MEKKEVIKLDTFDGHLVLLCKGHYDGGEKSDFFDEIKRIWSVRCGIDPKHFGEEIFEYIANRLYKIVASCNPKKVEYLHEIVHKSLSYTFGVPEGLSAIKKIIWAYRSELVCLQIKDRDGNGELFEIFSLPESQKEIFNRIARGEGNYKDYELITKLDTREI
jgi:hypothetical protein